MTRIEWLIDSGPFNTRDTCGDWPEWLIAASVTQDALIVVAYFAIPAALLRLYRRRQAVPHEGLALLFFSVFTLLCGLTHACGVLAFYWPAYRLFISVGWVAACSSVAVAIAAHWAVNPLAKVPTPQEYENALAEGELVRAELSATLTAVRRRADELEAKLAASVGPPSTRAGEPSNEFVEQRKREYQDMLKVLDRIRDPLTDTDTHKPLDTGG